MTTSRKPHPDRRLRMSSPRGRCDLRRAELAELPRFTAELPFSLDDFQRRACAALERGHGVLVCAPTGAGKTVVGEFAVHLALAAGGKCFYTTPLKALSNQKHTDLDGALRPRPDRPADRRHVGQRRCARGGDDHRSAAQHALRGFACAARTFACGDGRGAFPGRPDAGSGVGGGDPASARRGAAGQPVGDGEQRRGVRRLDPDRARRHHGRGRRTPAGAAVAARAGR